MFTGIIEAKGVIASLEALDTSDAGGQGTSLTIASAGPVLTDCHLGDSISVNGVCLTVTAFSASDRPSTTDPAAAPESAPEPHGGWFKVGVAPETLRRTNLGQLRPGQAVNLERALLSGTTRLGGHAVQGHVDSVAVIEQAVPDGNSLRMRFRPRRLPREPGAGPAAAAASDPSRSLLRHIVEKGFIAVDGTSLTVTRVCDGAEPEAAAVAEPVRAALGPETVAELEPGWFEVMLIAYTQDKVVQAQKRVGEWVNVEVDMAAKYIDRSVHAYFAAAERAGAGAGADQADPAAFPVLERMVSRIVEKKLEEIAAAKRA